MDTLRYNFFDSKNTEYLQLKRNLQDDITHIIMYQTE